MPSPIQPHSNSAQPCRQPMVLVWAGSPAPDQAPTEAEHALALSKAKVEQFERFFAQSPVFLSKEDFTGSPTGKAYRHVRLTLLKISFDVQRTNSLVSPFIGYLFLTCAGEQTGKCGDIVQRYGDLRIVDGFSTREKAIARARTCFKAAPPPWPMRFTFVYQDGRWVFKD